ncbi:MAG: tRNA (adenosine(37)-N6)-threonylcarbamoyltransferase complex transferase subunit TsaD [Flavobacteriales bacterium]|nr:tRNA (adenosine(37)-N6)-threonylcarbamoyltransferase complex transferase subunit TsaD [Flavobacteriales bacterium]
MRSTAPIIILGIESSCDETAAAVLVDGVVRSNVVAGQAVHAQWGGVVPELASRAHQENIVPVVHQALQEAGIGKEDLSAIAFTQGPGLIGALLVGSCFARSMAQALDVPLVAVDHLRAHALAHFIVDTSARPVPVFPFLNLTVSGGHTQFVVVHSPLDMEVIGTTLDDAAGEAFDKGAKMLGLPYPGGPLVDKLAQLGDSSRHPLPLPTMPGLDMSFSGLKTAFLNLLQRGVTKDPDFKTKEQAHLCASLQHAIVQVLLKKTSSAVRKTGIKQVAISGGVSANSGLRTQLGALARTEGWELFAPPLAYCTDNGAMIAMAGHFLFKARHFAGLNVVPRARFV